MIQTGTLVNNDYDVSVIVPYYNVEEYLQECLDSLLRQGDVKLQVILVDDGSPDNSAQIADAYAAKYDNFLSLHKTNGGLGHARNYGVDYATGKYICFVDSDDIVTDRTYEKMFRRAEKDGSELTICNVAKCNSYRTWSSNLHAKLFNQFYPVTHITKEPALIYDTTSWNKLILRSFYTEHGFRFPEGILYEDIPVTIPMHYLANQVSVLYHIGYLWRERDSVGKSITQETKSLRNLKDRVAILRMLDSFFDENVREDFLHVKKQIKALETDLSIFLNLCCEVSDEHLITMLDIINGYIKEAISPETLKLVDLPTRQKLEYAGAYDLEALRNLRAYQTDCYWNAPLREEDGRLLVKLPEDIFRITDRDVTEEVMKTRLRCQLHKAVFTDEGFSVTADIYRNRVNAQEIRSVTAYLYDDATGLSVPLTVAAGSGGDHKVQPEAAAADSDNEGSGLCGSISVTMEFNAGGSKHPFPADGDYMIVLRCETELSEDVCILSTDTCSEVSGKNRSSFFYGSTRVQLTFSEIRQPIFRVRTDEYNAETITSENGIVFFKLSRGGDGFYAVDSTGESFIRLENSGDVQFSLRLSALKENVSYRICRADDINMLRFREMTEPVLFRDKKMFLLNAGDEISLCGSMKSAELMLSRKRNITVLEESSNEKGALTIRARGYGLSASEGTEVTARLTADDPIQGTPLLLSETAAAVTNTSEAVCTFRFDLRDRRISTDLYTGIRNLHVDYLVNDEVVYSHSLISGVSFVHKFKYSDRTVRLSRNADSEVVMRVKQKLPEEENTDAKREALIARHYPEYMKEPLNPKRIIFESMWGKRYDCNPRALYEYIDENYPEYECIWLLNDPHVPIKGRGKRVLRGSLQSYYYLATAKYLVNNVNFPDTYRKRDGQIEIQTMHGTPLKTLGLDVTADFPNQSSVDSYLSRNSRWDYLIVQGRFMEDKAYDCFRFDKKFLRTGYPRTDSLFHSTDTEKEQIKKSLGIPLDKKVILYAPTWRVRNRFDLNLELDSFRQALQEDYVLLIRLHHLASNGSFCEDRQFVYDVTQYRSIEDLYQISDMMITDYSSAMFDYSLLDKPMIFYTYDMEEYCTQLRGLYVDFAQEAPGPIAADQYELTDAIINIEKATADCRERIDRFKDKYLMYENDHSCRTIIEEVFKPEAAENGSSAKNKGSAGVLLRKLRRLLKRNM